MDMKLSTLLMVDPAFAGDIFVLGAFAAFAGFGNLAGSVAGDTVPDQGQDQDQSDITKVQAAGTGAGFSVTMPTNVGGGTLYLFNEQPETQAPTHFGDYVDFDAAEATSGLERRRGRRTGVSVLHGLGHSSGLADTGSFGPGTYTTMLVDSSTLVIVTTCSVVWRYRSRLPSTR